jgi:DNA invertase Pin-like site-specific DNA recombinase
MATGNFVAYYRVSTKKQGDSGLGLEAQKEAVAKYLNGGDWALVAEFEEVETGTNKRKRPMLQAALGACKLHKATLIIAKLCRLSRSVTVVSSLLDSKVDFVCCDNPHATKTMLQFTAVMGEWEADSISKRTKEALAEKKALGEPTGATCWKTPGAGALSAENQKKGRALAVATIKAKSDDFAGMIMVKIRELRAAAPEMSDYGIAKALDAAGIPTMKGGRWAAATVKKILRREK